MILKMADFYDVIVVGSGIAGLSAAVEAASHGASTAIISSTHLFSGSSFYPGTWGFGLVGPENEDDIEEMIQTVHDVGCQMADPVLVKTFVSNINPAIAHLKSMGCHPRKASKTTEREFIPCFDHKHRNWNGLEFDSLRDTFTSKLQEHHVTILENCTLLELVKNSHTVCGAVFSQKDRLIYLGCKSLILATGGYGSIFRDHLCTDDVCGLGQFLALKAGCKLLNMEFMQMMPGYLAPARNTIFNEKTFRFAAFTTQNQKPLFTAEEEKLLDMRSMHGPFTSRLPSARIDHKICQASLLGADGVNVSYAEAAKNDPPEFIKIYFDWLQKEKQVSINDTIQIAIFAHAANGGVRIDEHGYTGVKGLFACGEVAGGMHGADRIGGLSTANGLVFGQRTGIAAAASALSSTALDTAYSMDTYAFDAWSTNDCAAIRTQLQELMYHHAMIIRNEQGLSEALDHLQTLWTQCPKKPESDIRAITDSRILEGQIMTSMCVLTAALMRRESRGSHFREDYPETNPAFATPIELYWNNSIMSQFSPYTTGERF